MGCVSSKHIRKQEQRPVTIINHKGGANHVVCLTSTTYGALSLDIEHRQHLQQQPKQQQPPIAERVNVRVQESKSSPPREEPEVINAWELMEGLEEPMPVCNQAKKSPKGNVFLKGFTDVDGKRPLKLLTQFGSPRKARKSTGKENKENVVNGVKFYTPKQVFTVRNSPDRACKAVFSLRVPGIGSPVGIRKDSFGCDSSSRRKSLSPLFDPELVASYEKELSEEGEEIKRVVSASPKCRKGRNLKNSDAILKLFEKKCPPGGENSVVIYTTTLRGIRKTFEECNTVRSIIESYQIQMYERDVSMDSGFREELRKIMGTKEVKVPILFVKGRLIGGVEQVVKMEEEGKLDALFNGIPRALACCEGCAGIRFVMCMECNGSCKVLNVEQKKMVRCSVCNENGLTQCPVCC